MRPECGPRRVARLPDGGGRCAALALALALSGLACSRPMPYELAPAPGWPSQADSLRSVTCLAADLDGDGADELAVEAPGGLRVLDWRDGRVTPAWAATLPAGYGRRPGSVQVAAGADLDGDGRVEILASAMRDDARAWGVWACNTSSRAWRLLAELPAGPDDRPDGAWDGVWAVGAVLPRGAGLAPAVVACSRTGFDASGRCVLALDGATGAELWQFACGPNPERMAACDLDGDGVPELVFTGNAQDNLGGKTLNGTSDDEAMLFALDARGGLLWSRVLGGVFTNTHLRAADLDGYGAVEIVTATGCHGAERDDHIVVWDGRGQVLAERILPTPAQGLLLVPACGPAPGLAYVGGEDGTVLRMAYLGGKLREQRRCAAPPGARPLVAADLAREAGMEVVIRSANGRLSLLSPGLEPLARWDEVPPRAASTFRPEFETMCAAWSPATGTTILLSQGTAHVVRTRSAHAAPAAAKLVTRDLAKAGRADPVRLTPFMVSATPADTVRSLGFLVADLDGDGRDELVAASSPGIVCFTWRDGQLSPLWTWEAPARFRPPWPGIFLDGAWDVTGDGAVEIVTTVASTDESEWRLWVMDPRTRALVRDIALPVGPDRRADGRWDGGWVVVGVLPPDGTTGAAPGLVMRCRTGFDWDLRQIRALEPDGRERWSHPIGPNPYDVHVADLEGDGRWEIVAGCSAGSNMHGETLGGLSDDHSVLLVLDADGRELWHRVLGPDASRGYAQVGDLDGDGRAEIVTATDSNVPGFDDRLCVWSAGGELLAERILPERPRLMTLAPAVGGRPGCIVTGGRQWAVHSYALRDGALHEIVRAERPAGFSVYAAFDIARASGPEIVVATSEDHLWLLSADLRPLARTDVNETYPYSKRPHRQPRPRLWAWRPEPGTTLLMAEGAGLGFVVEE